MLPEPHTRALVSSRLRTEPLILVVPSDQRCVARQAIKLRQIKGEPFIKPSKTAPTLRQAIENSLERSGLDMKANHEVHNLAHAFDDRIDGRSDPAAGVCKELPSVVGCEPTYPRRCANGRLGCRLLRVAHSEPRPGGSG